MGRTFNPLKSYVKHKTKLIRSIKDRKCEMRISLKNLQHQSREVLPRKYIIINGAKKFVEKATESLSRSHVVIAVQETDDNAFEVILKTR